MTNDSLSHSKTRLALAIVRMPLAPFSVFLRVIDQQTFERLLPAACEWARAQEEFVLTRGSPLDQKHLTDAARVGVRDTERVRLLVVDRMPLPAPEELGQIARKTQIITESCRAVAIGHGIIIRADAWGDRELVLHQLVHVMQCEQAGGLLPFVRQYLFDRCETEEFTVGAFEQEARRIAHEICATDGNAQ
jgi:hypothetical protein